MSVGVKAALIAGFFAVIAAAIALVPSFLKWVKDEATTVTTVGDNSHTTVFSATTSGSNSPISQTVNNISSYPTNAIENILKHQQLRQDEQDAKQDEMLAILHRMEGFREQKKQDPNFQAIFPTGYILFTATATATGRKEIVPLQPSPLDQIQFDWTKGYSIEMSPTKSLIRLPPFTVKRGASTGHFDVGSFALPRTPGQATSPMRFGDDELTFLVVSTNLNEIMVAVGLRPARSFQRFNVTK